MCTPTRQRMTAITTFFFIRCKQSRIACDCNGLFSTGHIKLSLKDLIKNPRNLKKKKKKNH